MEGLDSGDQATKMLTGLTASYLAAERHWNGETTVPDQIKGHPTTAAALGALTKRFAERFCTGDFKYIIDLHDGQYCFKLYRECAWQMYWHTIEAKALFHTARKISRSLVDILACFLHRLQKEIGVSTWYGGGMDYAEDWVDERIGGNWEYDQQPDIDPEDDNYRSMAEDLKCHRTGAAAATAKLISSAPIISPEQLLKRLSRIRKQHPLVDALILGCELMKQPYDIMYFDNSDCDDGNDEDTANDSLSFWEQSTIIWEEDNALTMSWTEWIDARSNESGVQFPIATLRIDPRESDCMNRKKFDNCADWPMQFQEVFRKLVDACSDQALLINVLAQ